MCYGLRWYLTHHPLKKESERKIRKNQMQGDKRNKLVGEERL